MNDERLLRLHEVSQRTGYKVSTLRKKIHRREIGYCKIGRIICVPESEVNQMVREAYRPQVKV